MKCFFHHSLILFTLPSTVTAFDWGDFHKVAVIFFSFLGPMLILSMIAAAAYFACIKSWYERFRDDVHETHRSYHPWPPGSAKWQLQQFINAGKGLPAKFFRPSPGEPPPGFKPPLIPDQAPLAVVAGAQYVGLLGTAPQLSVACLPSPQTTYTIAVDPKNKEQVPYTTVIRPKQEQAVPIETIFSAAPTSKPTIAPTVTVIPPDHPTMSNQIPISVITDYQKGNEEREPIIRSPIGGNVLYSQGHDWTQV
ncbi:unnamed protein product, partial [Mesorhabditis belari]|uniref:Uncharacterized protein n=1 Tax=Mesorhabditis belari TaxID=2138241 RepID=A0AAF3J849_9BILA